MGKRLEGQPPTEATVLPATKPVSTMPPTSKAPRTVMSTAATHAIAISRLLMADLLNGRAAKSVRMGARNPRQVGSVPASPDPAVVDQVELGFSAGRHVYSRPFAV